MTRRLARGPAAGRPASASPGQLATGAPRSRRATTARRKRLRARRTARSTSQRVARTCWRRRRSGPSRSRSDRRRRRRRSRSVRHRPRRRGSELPALDRRQVLADRVQRVDVGARPQQRVASCRCLSSSVRPSAGTAISADAPPDSRTSRLLVRPRGTRRARAPAARPRSLAGGRHRMAARDALRIAIAARSRASTADRRGPPRTRAPSAVAAAARHRRRRLAGRQRRCTRGRRQSALVASARSTSAPASHGSDAPRGRWPADRVEARARDCVSACAWDRTRRRARSRRRIS